MKKTIKIIVDIIVNIVVFSMYLDLLIFYVLYALLAYDYGKLPDDNVAVTESRFYDYFYIYQNDYSYLYSYIYYCFILLVVLKLFNIHLISKKQIIIFLLGFVLLFFLMFIDPFGAFKWFLYD